MAPRAQIGSYRVFNVPTPVGHVGNTPEIVAAFEAAVRDGMDVINFSGGGPQVDPASDAIIEAVRNVSAAGVVPVISAGNDRDDYGLGSAGSPGTAPDAISVAALSNSHVYGPALTVTAPGAADALTHVPFVRTAGLATPAAWANGDQQLVDVGTIMGTNSAPVPRDLCGPPGNLDGGTSPLPAGSLAGAIALVSRGNCTFALKASRVRAAGAIGIVLVDNRPGEANGDADPARRSRRDDRRLRRLRAALVSRRAAAAAPRFGSAAILRSSIPAAAASSPASRPAG